MKKLLAAFLALIMAFSGATVCLAQPAEAAPEINGESYDYGKLAWFAQLPIWPVDTDSVCGNFVYSLVDFFAKLSNLLGITDSQTLGIIRDIMKNGPILYDISWTAGETLLKKNKTVSFSATILSFDTLKISHSDNNFGSCYVEISDTTVDVYYCTAAFNKVKSVEHSLTIKDDISVLLSVNELERLSITVTSAGESFTQENFSQFSGRGSIKAESINGHLTDVSLSWASSDFNKDIWIMGDSYVSIDPSRWPYYLLTNKDNFALFGFPGAASPSLFDDFVNSLQHGKPAYSIWCLGMNEPDENGTANAQWKLYAEKFIAICAENGITPILATIPNVPERCNTAKNEYVKNSGHRYIDFAASVGAADAGSSWYDGMLHSDGVHPTASGAQALAAQVLKDLPELK